MDISRTALLLGAAALLVGTAGGSVTADSIDVGATAASPDATNLCSTGIALFQDTVAVPPSYTTTAGVVTSWSSMALAANPGTLELKIGREGPANTYTITGSSQPEPLVANRLNSFRTRIPVQAGDVLALYLPPQPFSIGCGIPTGNVGDTVKYYGAPVPDPAVGTVITTTTGNASLHLNVSARIEPDADGDGYGDLTQDACPALKNTHDDCLPPDTFLKTAPKKLVAHGKTARAKVVFFASEEGSTFTCSVDGAPATPCASPLKLKLKRGKHTVTVVATDKVGNVDSTPLVVRIKVTKG
jgi:hypothetical protein